MIRDHRVYKTRKVNQSGLIFSFILKIVILTFLTCQIINHCLISTVKVNSSSMEPTLRIGEGVFTSPLDYGFTIPLIDSFHFQGTRAPRRGDIALIKAPYIQEQSFLSQFLDSGLRFFTLNKKSLLPESPYMIKRIMALPGDTIKIENFMAYIKPMGGDSFIPEEELLSKKYALKINNDFPSGWNSENPFSGTMEALTLGEGQYFLLGDNRRASNDSLYFGAVKKEALVSRLLLRYHPLTRIKIP